MKWWIDLITGDLIEDEYDCDEDEMRERGYAPATPDDIGEIDDEAIT